MQNNIYVKNYDGPDFNIKEILRYAGTKEPSVETESLLSECISEIKGKLTYRVCFRKFPCSCEGEFLNIGFAKVKSSDLKKNLSGCDSIVLFAATVGIEIDRLIARYSRISPSKALMFQAIGAERIEALAGLFNDEIKNEAKHDNKQTAPRFSPGYGDLPLDFQKEIFGFLDCPRKIGLTLNESLIMSPSKSVTAIIGIGDKTNSGTKEGCNYCSKEGCEFRRAL